MKWVFWEVTLKTDFSSGYEVEYFTSPWAAAARTEFSSSSGTRAYIQVVWMDIKWLRKKQSWYGCVRRVNHNPFQDKPEIIEKFYTDFNIWRNLKRLFNKLKLKVIK